MYFTFSISRCKVHLHTVGDSVSIHRAFWNKKIIEAWTKSPIVWLAGVRRSGKTTLSKSFTEASYFNCDLLSVQDETKNPEQFYKNNKSKVYIFDEIHQLPEASLLLKVGADTQSGIKIIATGSSTIVASKKFKDTLTGRKRNLHFLPVLIQELENFKVDLKKRLLHGGLPPALLADSFDRDFYGEWLDSFYARDIQELFAVDKRQPFLKALEYLIASNGQLFETTKLCQASGVTRPTMAKYLDILQLTKAITIIRPFSKNPEQEIISQPKVYSFDTGFYCHVQNIKELRNEDCGLLLENLVLENFQAQSLGNDIHYWRTKSKEEIDFILPLGKDNTHAIECKWKESRFDDKAIQMFRRRYPDGKNWVVTSDSKSRSEKKNGQTFHFINIFDLPEMIHKLKL